MQFVAVPPPLFLPLFHFAVVPKKAESWELPATARLHNSFCLTRIDIFSHSLTRTNLIFIPYVLCNFPDYPYSVPLCSIICISLYVQYMCECLNKHMLLSVCATLQYVCVRVCEPSSTWSMWACVCAPVCWVRQSGQVVSIWNENSIMSPSQPSALTHSC